MRELVLSDNKKNFVTAIILAAGSGSRMAMEITKQRMLIHGESMLCHTLRAFQNAEEIDSVVLVVREDEKTWAEGEFADKFSKLSSIVIGGKSRAESAECGFEAVDNRTDFVAIHDGARCLVTPEMINRVVTEAYSHGSASRAFRNSTVWC